MSRIACLALLIAFLAAFAPAAESPSTRPATITVTALMLGTHQPVAEAKVSWTAEGPAIGSGTTDAAGQVAITGISDQCRYIIFRISRPALTPLFLRWGRSPDDPLPPSPTFYMEPAHRVGGIVVDAAGKPIAGATVVVEARKTYPGSSQNVDGLGDATTDATGNWSVDGVPASPDYVDVAAYDVMHLTDEFYSAEPYHPQSSLFAGTAKLTLPLATPIEVRVLEPDGTPAAGAKVYIGFHPDRYGNSMPVLTADAQGVAHIGCKLGMSTRLSATLPGFAPAETDTAVGDTPMRVTLRLAAATSRTLQVVDSAGSPIAGASIDIDNWRDGDFPSYERLKTDRTGRAVWADAPPDDVTAEVYAKGYTPRENMPWSTATPARVVLNKPMTIAARVVDADTGKPIPAFTIRLGAVWNEGDRMIWQPGENLNDARKEPGAFSLQLPDSAYRYLLRVQADGYFPADSDPIALAGKPASLEFQLKPGRDIVGKTLSANGRPVAGAQLYLVLPGDWLDIGNGELPSDLGVSTVLTRSDARGGFAYPPQKEDFALVAISDSGSATITRSQVASPDANLTLSPWATIHGTITIAGKPAANTEFFGRSDPITIADGTQLIAREYHFTTDETGNFDLPRVFPGKLIVYRQAPNFAPERIRYVDLATLDVKPGAHYQLALGQGAAVTGMLAIPPGKPWMVRIARLDRKDAAPDADFENVDISADGHFRAEGISPGNYVLHVALHEYPPGESCGWGRLVAQFDRDITVPPGGASADAGTIAPTQLPGPILKIGDAAPDFTAKTLDGKTLRLVDFRGKIVLLDFWACWCAPCIAELPNLKKIAAAHSADPRFAMVSLSLDDDPVLLSRILNYYKLTWPQARVGIEGAAVKAYGATAVPATFLIGPDGKILARDLRGADLQKAVDAAVKKP